MLASYLFYSWLDKFCISEVKNCGLTGPFFSIPFQSYHLSPMMTADKKPNKRRPVFDASFGMSINKNTSKEYYLDDRVQYDYPTLDDFQQMILEVGRGGRMWKRDLSRFFLQIPLCPSDYQKTGFIWRTNFFFFVSCMFGLCHSGLAVIVEAFLNVCLQSVRNVQCLCVRSGAYRAPGNKRTCRVYNEG